MPHKENLARTCWTLESSAFVHFDSSPVNIIQALAHTEVTELDRISEAPLDSTFHASR